MTEYAGYEMPVEYSGVTDEHLTVRNKAGVFDVSHMGEIRVKGSGALEYLQYVTTNDVSRLERGKAQYSCFPNEKGGIVDDLLVYKFEEEEYLLVVNASNTEKDFRWLNQHNKSGVILENASDRISQLAIQGPVAEKILQKLTATDLSDISNFSFVTGKIAGCNDVIISRTGYTGSGGFELYFSNDFAEKIWDAIFESGKDEMIKPVGLAARDTLRLEAGYCLYGNDIDETTSPIEAGLGWITKFTVNKNFINRDFLEKQKKEGTKRKLTGFEMIDRGIPRQHYIISDKSGQQIGEVTSGTMSPVSKTGIGMGYILTSCSSVGSEIYINIRNKLLKAGIVHLPFYKL